MVEYLWLILPVVGLGGPLAFWAFLVEPGRLVVTERSLETPLWPISHEPLRIALISDLHVGAPHVGLKKLDQVVERVNGLDPDVVLIAGDFMVQRILFGKSVSPEAIAERLRALRARFGVVAVLGNHDWRHDGHHVSDALSEVGITVLENQAHRLELPGGALWIAGIADDTTREPDVEGTLAQVPETEPVIVLAHDPATFLDVPHGPVAVLAGHTHGGQVSFPFFGALYLPSRAPRHYAYGHIVEEGRNLFVTSGVGTSLLPVRFNMPPEVKLLTVSAAAAAAE